MTERNSNWKDTIIHFGKSQGIRVGDLPRRQLVWWVTNWFPNPAFCRLERNRTHKLESRDAMQAGAAAGCKDCALRLALDAADDEIFKFRTTPV